MRVLIIALLCLQHRVLPQDCDTPDNSAWQSEFGNCASYAKDAASSNWSFCGEDADLDGLVAADACPNACENCAGGGGGDDAEEECNLVIYGREGLNSVINGPYSKVGDSDEYPFFIHSETNNIWIFYLQLENPVGDVTFEGWVIGGELWDTQVYAFVQGNTDHPSGVTGSWTIWDGEAWVADSKIKSLCGCINPITKLVSSNVLCGSTICSGNCEFDANAFCSINTCGGCHDLWVDSESNFLNCDTDQCDIRIAGRAGFNDVINGLYQLVPGERHLGRPYYLNPTTMFFLYFTVFDWWIISDEFAGESYYAYCPQDVSQPEFLQEDWNVFAGDDEGTVPDPGMWGACGGTCFGNCGSQSPRFDCSCTEDCFENGDCCVDFEEFCVVGPECEDVVDDWVDSAGEDCASYERNGWCGDVLNVEFTNVENNLSSDENCCVCGGGQPEDDEDPPTPVTQPPTQHPTQPPTDDTVDSSPTQLTPTQPPPTQPPPPPTQPPPTQPPPPMQPPPTQPPPTQPPPTQPPPTQAPTQAPTDAPPPADSPPASGGGADCEDVEDWTDIEGTECDSYVRFLWCGDPYNDAIAANGVSADDACCGCGGGQQEVGQSDGPSVCEDDDEWTSLFGACNTYASSNNEFCGDDEGFDGVLADDACPEACGNC